MPIGELSRRIGVSTDLLRKWERRYGVPRPGRTLGNQRLYSRVDEVRLRLMLGHMRNGAPPAQAAELAMAARLRVKPGTSGALAGVPAPEVRRALLAALERFDETAAEQVLEKLVTQLSDTAIVRDVLLPLMRDVGERWEDGRLGVAHEHFATWFVHDRLLAQARGWDRGLGPRALLACPAGEQHTLGLIAFGIALHALGWRITYLGADVPPAAVGDAADVLDPELIVIAALLPMRLESDLAAWRKLANRRPVAVGGAGVTPALAARCGARHLAGDPLSAAEALVVHRNLVGTVLS